MTTPPSAHPAQQPVYLLTLTPLDSEADYTWWGGPVAQAVINLGALFGALGRPANAGHARRFAEYCVRQLQGFPAEARQMAHEFAAEALEDFPQAIATLDPLLVPDVNGKAV